MEFQSQIQQNQEMFKQTQWELMCVWYKKPPENIPTPLR